MYGGYLNNLEPITIKTTEIKYQIPNFFITKSTLIQTRINLVVRPKTV